MFSVTDSGSFDNTISMLKTLDSDHIFDVLNRYGHEGVSLLSAATPIETGLTAHSWDFEVTHDKGHHTLTFSNSHNVSGVNIAVILQYGHGTGTGGYVEGIDYINPALRNLFDTMVADILREVNRA